ncbi:MerR family transcriptional regulator [Beduini massiliensis]|uniref:MerR family transcriptional regulator n=1 Tax=Beduini massiliensis TaxID=1585974 RepID=UPI00164DAC66|nr:MerR family transcriptional regulator [Beduini massiliensis]
MLAKQVMELTGITKKALEYYENKKLLSPSRLPSGYRDYNEQDIFQIKTILLLRQLDFSVEDITHLINDRQFELFNEKKKKINRQVYDLQTNLLYLNQTEELLKYQDSSEINSNMDQEDDPQEILDELLEQIQEDRQMKEEVITNQALNHQQIGICLLLISLSAGIVSYFGLKNDDLYITMYFFSLFLLSDKLYYSIKLFLLEIKEKLIK